MFSNMLTNTTTVAAASASAAATAAAETLVVTPGTFLFSGSVFEHQKSQKAIFAKMVLTISPMYTVGIFIR